MIKIKKGLDLPIEGAAEKRTTDARSIACYGIKPTDFVGLVPRLLVGEGDEVRVGDALFCDKRDERIRFTSPVAGRVKAVVRGPKRLLLAVVVEKHDEQALLRFDGDVKERMMQTGLWTALRQRPFGTVANPDERPKAIVVSCFDSAPLAPDYDYVMQGREEDLWEGLEALSTLTDGKLYACFKAGQRLGREAEKRLVKSGRISVEYFDGPHPAGNVGTQIAHLCPIDKGDVVWTMGVQDVAVLGRLMRSGEYCPERLLAVAGPEVRSPHYYRIVAGACVEGIVSAQRSNPNYPALTNGVKVEGIRVISGNVLSGSCIEDDGFVGAYDSLLTLMPEGNYYDFMGWLLPGLNKYSFSRTFWSGFVPSFMHDIFGQVPRMMAPKFDTNMHGGVRPLVFTGNFERVFPFDIYPLQLLKACIIGDIDLMEKLGIYEVEPEDFALCEYIDPSKTDIQPIIREALEKLRKEAL